MANNFVPGFGAQITLHASALGQQVLNTFGYLFWGHPDDGPFPTDADVLNKIIDVFEAEVLPAILDLVTPSYNAFMISCIGINSVPTVGGTSWNRMLRVVRAINAPGVHVGDTGSTFDAAGLALYSTYGGKAGRGSNRFGPLSEDTVNNNTLAPADVTLLSAIGEAITDGQEAAFLDAGLPVHPAVLSLGAYLGTLIGPGPAVPFNQIVSWYAKTFVTSQISRKDRAFGQ